MSKFKNKNILFISWDFYNYPIKIKEEIERQGGNVVFYQSFPTSSNLLAKFTKKYAQNLITKHYKKIIKETKNINIDIIFIIKGTEIPTFFYEYIKDNMKNAKKILYLWDSLCFINNIKDVFKYFNKIYSFDLDDANKNDNIIFRPLFYIKEFYNKDKIKDAGFTFSFVGFGHSDRYNFLKKVKAYANENGYSYNFRLFLPSLLHFIKGKYIKKNIKNAGIDDFVFKNLSHKEISNIMKDSNIIVDIQLKNQTGLTMRTIETIGMRKKLITTNDEVIKYNFYNTNNVLIVDRENPEISKEFIEGDYKVLSDEIYDYYNLEHWVCEVLS